MKKKETTKESLNKAQSASAQKQWRGGGAIRDYQSEQQAIREKIARLSTLRSK